MKAFWVLVLVLFSCEDLSLRTYPSEGIPLSEQAHLQFSSRGVGSLFRAKAEGGLKIEAQSVDVLVEGGVYTLGPLDESIPIINQAVNTRVDFIDVGLEFKDLKLPIALRSTAGELLICRYRINASKIEISAVVEIRPEEGIPRLSVVGEPSILIEQFTISPVARCDINVDLMGLEQQVKDYLLIALMHSSTRLFESSPTELVGIPNGTIELSKVSRSGSILIEQAITPMGAFIDDEDVRVGLSIGLRAKRDPCVPPLSFEALDPSVAVGLVGSEELALSFSKPMLKNLFSAAVIGGLLCNKEDIRRNNSNLSDIGLQFLELDSDLEVKFLPASLPTLSFLEEGLIRIQWPLVTMDVHGSIYGAKQRLLLVNASARVDLRPRVDANQISFDVESMKIDTSEVETKWSKKDLVSPAMDRWVGRLLLLAFESKLKIPSPLNPEINLRMTNVQTTEKDVVLEYVVGK